MKAAMTRAVNVPLALELVYVAADNDMADLGKLIANGAETALLKADIANRDNNTASFDMQRMIELQDDTEALNVALYAAAYHGHEAVVDYFLGAGAFCQKTLNVAFYGAVISGRPSLVKKLASAGADVTFEGEYLLERAIANNRLGHQKTVAEFMVEASGDYAHALAAYLANNCFDRALDMLDHDIDVRKGLNAIVNRLTDRAMLVSGAAKDQLIDFFDMLMSYAKAKGGDMPDLVSYVAACVEEHWASPVTERLIDGDYLTNHPKRQEIIEQLAVRTAKSSNVHFDTGYQEYDQLALKLLQAGASPQPLLHNAMMSGNIDLCNAALKAGADPRRGNPSVLAEIKERAQLPHAHSDYAVIAATLDRHAKELTQAEEETLKFFSQTNSSIGALRNIDAAGRTGLMLAVSTGKAQEAVQAYIAAGEKISSMEFSHKDKTGMSVIDLLCDKGVAALFCDARLFKDVAVYRTYWQSLPQAVQTQEAERHKDVLFAFSSMGVTDTLAARRLNDKRRWKI